MEASFRPIADIRVLEFVALKPPVGPKRANGEASAGTWSEQAYVKASNTEAGDWFGIAVALSADGNTLAVGAGGQPLGSEFGAVSLY